MNLLSRIQNEHYSWFIRSKLGQRPHQILDWERQCRKVQYLSPATSSSCVFCIQRRFYPIRQYVSVKCEKNNRYVKIYSCRAVILALLPTLISELLRNPVTCWASTSKCNQRKWGKNNLDILHPHPLDRFKNGMLWRISFHWCGRRRVNCCQLLLADAILKYYFAVPILILQFFLL